MIKLEAAIRRLEARISRGHAQDIRYDIIHEGRLDTDRNEDIGIESPPLTGSLHLPAIEALERKSIETNVSPPGTLYLPAFILTSPTLAHGLRSFLHQTTRLDRTNNYNLTPSQHHALTQQRQHLPYLYNARLRAGKAPYNIEHVAGILDRLLFGGLLGLTEAEDKGVSIARVMWARKTSIQPHETETYLGQTTRDEGVTGLDATTAGDGEDEDRDEDTELATTTSDREDIAEGEATRITTAPATSDGNGNSGDKVRDKATELNGTATIGTSEDGATSEAPRLASNTSGENEDRVRVEVEGEGKSKNEGTELITTATNSSGEGIEETNDSGLITTPTRILV